MNLNTLTETLQFFAMISAELIALFFVVSFMVAMMQEYVPASTVQRLLTARPFRSRSACSTPVRHLAPPCPF